MKLFRPEVETSDVVVVAAAVAVTRGLGAAGQAGGEVHEAVRAADGVQEVGVTPAGGGAGGGEGGGGAVQQEHEHLRAEGHTA